MTKQMKIERSQPLTDQEKQLQPLPGEVDPKDARRVATHFAAVERLRLDALQPTRTAPSGGKGSGKK